MSSISVQPLTSPAQKRDFIKFPWKIYKGNPVWVPPLLRDRRKLMDKKSNPFYKQADAEFFLATRNGEVVGRIGAIVNHNHNKEHNEKIGFFGFFESIDDQEVASALLLTAQRWVSERGMTGIRGPASPSVNDEYGLLVDGFSDPPAILMSYNPPYYAKLIENYGFTKAKDLYAYKVQRESVFSEKFVRGVDILKKRSGLVIRTLDMKNFDSEIKVLKDLYNRAWQYNWGSVPMTSEEFDSLAKDLKPIVVPGLVLIAEFKGEPVGFSLSLPDLNQALKYNTRGWLLPGVIRLMIHKKKIKRVRIIVLGVVPEFRKTGAGGILLYEAGKHGIDLGYYIGEASWVLEDNVMMNRAAEFMNGERYKTYRIYELNFSKGHPHAN